jgi:hypothetical protein
MATVLAAWLLTAPALLAAWVLLVETGRAVDRSRRRDDWRLWSEELRSGGRHG